MKTTFPYTFFLLLGALTLTLATSCEDEDPFCEETTWYQDADADGLGDPACSTIPQPTLSLNKGQIHQKETGKAHLRFSGLNKHLKPY